MEGTEETEAKTLPKRRGTKSGKQKTQAEKQRHNESCRRSRLKMKTMHKDRDQEFLKLQADNKTIKTELQYQAKKGIEYHEKLQLLIEDNQILRIDLHTMKEKLERERQIAVAMMAFHGHNFTSFDQAVEWFASQNYAGGGQVSRASGTGLQNVNGLVGSIPVPTINFQPSMEFENYKSKTELELQQLRRTIKASEELMKQLFIHLMAYYGHNFGSFDQAVKWFASQNYAGGGQVSRASGTGLQSVNELVASVPVPTIDFQPSMVDFDQQMCFGQDNANIAAFTAAGPAYTADHAASSAAGVSTITNPTLVFGSTNNNEKDDDLFSFVTFHLHSLEMMPCFLLLLVAAFLC